MIENRPWLTGFSHLVLVLGVLVVALPVWVAIVASTHPANAFGVGHIPLNIAIRHRQHTLHAHYQRVVSIIRGHDQRPQILVPTINKQNHKQRRNIGA